MPTPPTTRGRAAPARHHSLPDDSYTGTLPYETLVLGAALVAAAVLVLAVPDIALLIVGIPAAIVLGVGIVTGVARLLAR